MSETNVVCVLNYHSVGDRNGRSAELPHSVPIDHFEEQIHLAAEIGTFVSVHDLVDGNVPTGPLFVATFDDVPLDARAGIALLEEWGIPYVVSVCGALMQNGHGTRDKVYAIVQHFDAETVRAAVGAIDADAARDSGFSFYEFAKSGRFDPQFLEEELIEPLYAQLKPEHKVQARRYFAAEHVRETAAFSLATIANHGWSHRNYAALGNEARRADILRAHELLSELVGKPDVFTVPFGYVTQPLLAYLTAVLDDLGYRAVLWTENRTQIVARPRLSGRLLHLLRFHVPPTAAEFADRTRALLREPVFGPVALLPVQTVPRPATVHACREPRAARRFELIVRPTKEYAASADFYRYQFDENPYRDGHADYHVSESDGVVEAIVYRFQVEFVLGGSRTPGVYVSGWRRMPEASARAATAVLRRLLDNEAIVGVYRPSSDAEPAFRSWARALVYECDVAASSLLDGPVHGVRSAMRMEWFSSCPDELERVASATIACDFSVARTNVFYRWRFDRYPLLPARYGIATVNDAPVAFVVVQHTDEVVAVADFGALSDDIAVEAFTATAREFRRPTLRVQTSIATLAERLSRWGTITRFSNHYRLAGRSGVHAASPPLRFHETHATGDVLLR